MTNPILYSFRRCPYAMRARLALAVSGQEVILREVDLKNKPSELLETSPKGTVPVLVLEDGTIIEQSLEIMYWSLERNDPAHWLTMDAAEKTQSESLITFNDGAFKQQLDRYKYPSRYPDYAGNPKAEIEATLQRYETLLTQKGFLLAATPKLADVALFPFVRQCAGVEPEWFASAPYPKLRAWLAHFEDSALFARVMEKFEPWKPADTPLLVFAA